MTLAENVVSAFSADHVIRLTGLSMGQLRYWDETGFFSPHYAFENRRNPYSRVYSFRDVVGLRTLAILRKRHRVSLQHLRQVAEKLSYMKDTLWSGATLHVLNREVYFREPETGRVRGAISGQYVAIPLVEIISDVAADANRLKERAEEQIGKVVRHRYTVHNAWVLAGTRIPIKAIERFSEAGFSTEEIIREYPSLTVADVEAALQYKRTRAKTA